MEIKLAILRGFDPDVYRATVEMTGSRRAYLDNIAVALSLPADEMVNGRKLVVLFGDAHNAGEAVVIAVYS